MAAIFPTIAAVAAAVTMMIMSLVRSYDDGSGYCTGIQNRARCSRSQLPMPNSTEAQSAISVVLRDCAVDVPSVCYHLHMTPVGYEDPIGVEVYCYFTCNAKDCYQCYDKAFDWLKETDGSGCPGNDGAYISLDDGCCLRYETNNNFCGAR